MFGKHIFMSGLLVLPLSLQAIEVDHSITKNTVVETGIAESQRIERLARRWEVTSEEWIRYEEIMQGEGRYHWRDVDPLVVLGIYAKDETERKRFARLTAEKEYRLQSRFTQFNQAYVKAFHHLYGSQPIIELEPFYEQYRQRGISSAIRDPAPHSTLEDKSGDRTVLFLNTHCARCDDWFRNLKDQTNLGSAIDLYFIDESSDAIGQWAKRIGIDPVELDQGALTLNQDSGQYNQYGRPGIPAAYYYDASYQSVLRLKDGESLP